MELLGDIEKTDKTLGDKIREFFRDIVQLLKDTINAYRGVEPDSIEGRLVSQMNDLVTELQQVFAEGIYEAGQNYQRVESNTVVETDKRYQARRLTERDLDAYLHAGSRKNGNKVRALEENKSIILTSEEEIADFINNAIEKKTEAVTVAYGKVNERLAKEVYNESNGKIAIDDFYLELIPTDLQHAYEQHSKGKEKGDIDLSREDFKRIPEYLDSFTEVLYAIKYSSGFTRICVSKKLHNGRILIIETVSKSRGSIQFKNAIGVSEEKYKTDYLRVYKKRAGTNTGESKSSKNAPRDITDSKNNILKSNNVVKDNSSTDSDGDPKNKLSVRKNLNTSVTELLQQENSKLKEDVHELKELLKLQRTVTGGTKFTKSSVEVAARMLKQSANAKGDTTQLAKLLNSFYEQIATNKELTWDTVKELAQPAVDWLQSNVNIKPERSEYAQDILSFLRTSRIYLDESQVTEAAYRYGSFNDYRKMMMGSVIIAKDGAVSLDTKWNELATLYPDVFDIETSAADQPEALMNAISRLRNSDTSALEYEYNRKLIAQDLLRQVYDSYWRVSTLYTVADVKQREINQLKAQHYQRMDKLRTIGGIKITKSHLR